MWLSLLTLQLCWVSIASASFSGLCCSRALCPGLSTVRQVGSRRMLPIPGFLHHSPRMQQWLLFPCSRFCRQKRVSHCCTFSQFTNRYSILIGTSVPVERLDTNDPVRTEGVELSAGGTWEKRMLAFSVRASTHLERQQDVHRENFTVVYSLSTNQIEVRGGAGVGTCGGRCWAT